MYEVLKKVQSLAEEIGPVTSVTYSGFGNGYINVEGAYKDGRTFSLSMIITDKEAANE